MLIEPGLHLVASGASGFDLTDRYDAHAWLFAGKDCNLLFDAGAGRSVETILAIGAADGLDWSRPTKLFLTHGHADHSGGAAELRERLTATAYAGVTTAEWLQVGDPAAISLPAAQTAGIYPADYRWRPCPIDCAVADRELHEFGEFSVQAVATPGHSADHTAWLVRRGARTWLVGGDTLFHGGRIALQHTADCDAQAHARSLRLLLRWPLTPCCRATASSAFRTPNGMSTWRSAGSIVFCCRHSSFEVIGSSPLGLKRAAIKYRSRASFCREVGRAALSARMRLYTPGGLPMLAKPRAQLTLPDHPFADSRASWTLAELVDHWVRQGAPREDILQRVFTLLENPERPAGLTLETGRNPRERIAHSIDPVPPGALDAIQRMRFPISSHLQALRLTRELATWLVEQFREPLHVEAGCGPDRHSLSFDKADQPLLQEMEDALRSDPHLSIWDATDLIARQGHG